MSAPPIQVLLLILLLAWTSAGQGVVWAEPRAVTEAVVVEIGGIAGPALIRVHGRRGREPRGDVRLLCADDDAVMLSGHRPGPDHWRAAVPVWEAPDQGVVRLRLEPVAGGARVGPIRWEPAQRHEFRLSDPEGRPLAGHVAIAALDGREAPDLGVRPRDGVLHHRTLCPQGEGKLLLPRGARATFLARCGPFRAPIRRRLIATGGDRVPLNLRFGASALPRRAWIEDRCAPPEGLPNPLWWRVMGMRPALEGLPKLDPAPAFDDESAFVRHLLSSERPPLLLGLPDGEEAFRHPYALRTVRLGQGLRLLSNGPVLTAVTRFGGLDLGLRLPAGVGPGTLEVHTAAGRLLRKPLADRERHHLPRVPRGRLIVRWKGDRFPGEGLLTPPPLAFLSLLIP